MRRDGIAVIDDRAEDAFDLDARPYEKPPGRGEASGNIRHVEHMLRAENRHRNERLRSLCARLRRRA
jgi:hypothetical protein